MKKQYLENLCFYYPPFLPPLHKAQNSSWLGAEKAVISFQFLCWNLAFMEKKEFQSFSGGLAEKLTDVFLSLPLPFLAQA